MWVEQRVEELFLRLNLQELDDQMASYVKYQQGRGVQKPKIDLVLVILPPKSDEVRHAVKHWGDVSRGKSFPYLLRKKSKPQLQVFLLNACDRIRFFQPGTSIGLTSR